MPPYEFNKKYITFSCVCVSYKTDDMVKFICCVAEKMQTNMWFDVFVAKIIEKLCVMVCSTFG